MQHNVFSVFDVKALAFLPPFVLHQDGMAIRTFCDCVNNPEHPWGEHPEDYTLYKCGTFNDSNGEFKSIIPAIPLKLGTEVVTTKTFNQALQTEGDTEIEKGLVNSHKDPFLAEAVQDRDTI